MTRKPGAAGAARETLRVETPDPAGAGPSFTPSKGSSAASAAAPSPAIARRAAATTVVRTADTRAARPTAFMAPSAPCSHAKPARPSS